MSLSPTNSANINSANLIDTIRSARIRYVNLGKGIEQLERRLQLTDFPAYCQLLLEDTTRGTGAHAPVKVPTQPKLHTPPQVPIQRTGLDVTEMPTTRLSTTNTMQKIKEVDFASQDQQTLINQVVEYIKTHKHRPLRVKVNGSNYNILSLLDYEQYLVFDKDLKDTKIVCLVQ